MENFIEEPVEVRRARLRQMEKDENEARTKQIEDASAPTRNVNAEYFAKQEALAKQIAENKSISLPKQTNAEAIAAQTARYPRPAVNPQPFSDSLMDRESDASRRAACYVTPKLKASISLQPSPEPYASSAPRRDMSEDLIIRMGMCPD